ncbi:MAG: type II toxin-antitoxin system RelE/ParE family toxin, partial [Polaribacter sp.]
MYVLKIVSTEKIVSTKFVKHLVGTIFYELKIDLNNNANRVILFAIDNENFMNSTQVLLLN